MIEVRINPAFYIAPILLLLITILPISAVEASALPSTGTVAVDTGPRLTGHRSWINSVRLSPDGETLATGSLGGTIKLWDIRTGAELHSIRNSLERVTAFRFSPDGSVLASGRLDGNIELRDPATGQLMRRLRHDVTSALSLAFSPDGTRLASGHRSGKVHLWDVETGNHLKQFKAQRQNVSSLAFSPDGTQLVTAGHGGSVKLWNSETGKKTATISTDTIPINVISFSPGGRFLVWGGWNGKLVARDMNADTSHNRPFTESVGGIVKTIRFYPGGEKMVSASRKGNVKVWNVKTGKTIRATKNDKWSAYTMVLTPDRIIMGGIDKTTGGYDGIVTHWAIGTRL